MEELRNFNAELLSRHRGLVESLTKEAKALRQEEIKFAEAFAKLPPELATPDTFELFMRDIHSAHEELRRRLLNIIHSTAAQELLEAKNIIRDIEEGLGEANEIIEELQSQKKKSEADSKQSARIHADETGSLKNKIKNLEESLTRKNDRINSLEKKVRELEEQQHNVKQYAAKLKKDYLVALHHDSEWDLKDISTCSLIEQLLGLQKNDLENIENCRKYIQKEFVAYSRDFRSNRDKIREIREAIETASQNLGMFSKKAGPFLDKAKGIIADLQKSYDAKTEADTVKKIVDSLNEQNKQLNYAKDRCTAINDRMSSGSLLPRLINELKGTIDNFS